MSEAAELVRGHRQVWAAPNSSHDQLIGVIRIALPVAIGVLVVLLAMAPLTSGRDISFVLAKDNVQVARERMRVSNATYRGEDTKGQPFEIRATSAVQTTSRDPVVRMQTLDARIALTDGLATIGAPRGRYDMEKERVYADGPILFRSADGYRVETRDVGVDLKTRTMASAGPVTGQMPLGTFSGDRLFADLETHVVTLRGRARLHIVQGAGRGRR
jgi:lipopolysaccharide export system protein LptC